MSAHEDKNHDGNHSVRFEPTDVSTKPVAYSVLALAVFTVLFTIVAHYSFQALAERERLASPTTSPIATQYAAKQPPEPRLQLDPRLDLVAMRAAHDKILGTLAWVDKDAGLVQVPIERAMEMVLAKGLPARQGPVPLKMSPQGVAPSQGYEASGAPDWFGGGGIGHSENAHGAASGDGHGKPAHKPASAIDHGKPASDGHGH